MSNYTPNRPYVIYRILNTVIDRSYIGLTLDYKKRKYDHLLRLENGDHINEALQRAYDKYGKDILVWDILESNIPTQELAEARERYWIKFYNSYLDGYNMNTGGNLGDAYSIPCEWNGVQYKSIADAAITLGIEPSSMGYRVKMGYVCDDDLTLFNIPCEWNGVQYESVSEAARTLGITQAAMSRRLVNGYTCDEDMKGLNKPCVWNNVSYDSVTEAANAIGLNRMTMYKRIRKGYTSDDEVPAPLKSPCVWNGIEYGSMSEAARALGINQSTVRRRLDRGYTCDDDMRKS